MEKRNIAITPVAIYRNPEVNSFLKKWEKNIWRMRWIAMVLLIIVTVTFSVKVSLDKNKDWIRSIWYVLYIVDALVYLTINPTSLFDEWVNYFIVLVAFVIIDYLLILNLYISKFSGNEFFVTEKQSLILKK